MRPFPLTSARPARLPTYLGAVFISTLAVHKLPYPDGREPETQPELLAKSIQPIIAFVVLCSILVHGLSIPFFSLGRRVHSVSRTWSRQHSGAADWTTLTRRVSKAEDIVINRDAQDINDRMERGDATPAVTINEKEDITLAQGPTVTEKPVLDGGEASGSTPTVGTGISDGEDMELTGTELEGSLVLAEWREGPHQVIERRIGPGGEVCLFFLYHRASGMLTGFFLTQVEVEVRRNVFGPEDAERITSRFVGGESEVRTAVGDYLRWLKEDAHKRAEGLMEDLRSAEEEIKRRLSPKAHTRTIGPPQQVAGGIHRSASDQVEEDGWASDKSDTRASRPTVPKSLGGKPTFSFKRNGSAKTKKHIRPSTPGSPSHSREHSEVRGDTPSPHRHSRLGGSGLPVSRTATWEAGSPYYHPRSPSIHPDSRRGSVRNLRIESLRSAGLPGSPRELSPARSVRFADSHPPRTPLPMSDMPVSASSQPRSGDREEEDSPRHSKVAFELPSDKH